MASLITIVFDRGEKIHLGISCFYQNSAAA